MAILDGEDDKVWRTYFEASLLLETTIDEDLRRHTKLSLIDYHVLLLLAEAPQRRLRMGELADRMVFSASRVTYQVSSMEKRGLVLRQRAHEDKRVYHAVLTANGLEALRSAAPHHAQTVRKLFTHDLSEEELRLLGQVFDRLWQRLTGG